MPATATPLAETSASPLEEATAPSTIQGGAWKGAFIAGLAGWTLDAFDFFLVVMSLTSIGREFGQDLRHMTYGLTATLWLRPVGAFLFGSFADRYGRRIPLVINLCLFAVVEIMTGFAPSFTAFIVIRAVFGIVMGGQWGVGVSLAMEKVPGKYRGVLSGLLQQGYAIGFLLASAAYFLLPQARGWRPLFMIGCVPALLAALFILLKVKESETWQQNRQSSFAGLGKALASHWKLFVYLIAFMMTMHMSSHGTQDMYPTFLEKDWGIIGRQKAELSALSMLGAILGGLSIGWISDRVGRRRAMIGAIVGALVVIPLWAHASTLSLLVLGAILMQFFVQGAWGVVPAYLTELSPHDVRATLPGLANQIGVVLSTIVLFLETTIAKGRTFASAMSITAAVVFCLAILLTLSGRGRGRDAQSTFIDV